MTEKPLVWLGSSHDDVRAFPTEARRSVGHQLYRVQVGLMPNDWKAMSGVGHGVLELRVRAGVEHRVFYVAKFPEAVYVLHAFEKRSRKTRPRDIAVARERLKHIQRMRIGSNPSK